MGATSWTSFTALYLPSVWKWEKGNADRRAERNKWGYLKCSCCSLVFIPSSPLRPPQQFLVFTETNLPCRLSGSEGQGQWQVCSPRSLLRWEFSASRSKAGVMIPRLPVFHSAPGYMYFFFRHGRWWNTKSTKDYPNLFNSWTICVLLLFGSGGGLRTLSLCLSL